MIHHRTWTELAWLRGDSDRTSLPFVPRDIMENIKNTGRAGSDIENYYLRILDSEQINSPKQ